MGVKDKIVSAMEWVVDWLIGPRIDIGIVFSPEDEGVGASRSSSRKDEGYEGLFSVEDIYLYKDEIKSYLGKFKGKMKSYAEKAKKVIYKGL